jgi:hypothetical protein
MRKTLLVSVLLLTVSLCISLPVRAASLAGTDYYTNYNFSTTLLGTVADSTFYHLSFSSTLTGILPGSCSVAGTEATGADGSATAWGTATCSGTVAGIPGTFQLAIIAAFTPAGAAQLWFSVTGSGRLADLHGGGTGQGTFVTGKDAVLLHFGR